MGIDPSSLSTKFKLAIHRPPALRQPNAIEIREALSRPTQVIPAGVIPSAAGIQLTITGQVRGGKNGMGVNAKTGRHYAKAPFAKWRDAAVREIRGQLPSHWKAIDHPVNVILRYVAGDKRRRDFPAIVDAAWHVLEKAGVVSDDTHLWPVQSSREYDKAAPKLTITFL